MRRVGFFIGLALVAAGAMSWPAGPLRADPRAPRESTVRPDPLLPLLRRMDRYFQRNEVDGVVLDARYTINYTEAVRLSVTSQLLGYVELQRVHPSARVHHDIVQRADFLIDRLDLVLSNSPFDGMLGYALLGAYETTHDPRYLAKGTQIVDELEAMYRGSLILNGGLMAAMAFALHHHLTGDPGSGQAAHDVLALLPPYQHTDGSFPHWCDGTRDVHYTDWMTTELILIQRVLDDPVIAPTLARMDGFLMTRVDTAGVTHYVGPCIDPPVGVCQYYSIATGCTIDYDTRAFTNELGYSALLFDYFHESRYLPVMHFLDGLERGGTIPDKWDFWPPPSDPYYVWTASDTSVVNMSVLFWSLASVVAQRPAVERDELGRLIEDPGDPAADDAADEIAGRAGPPHGSPTGAAVPPRGAGSGWVRFGAITPNPAQQGCVIPFFTRGPASVSVRICDAAGRSVREVQSGTVAAGWHAVRWDQKDASGTSVSSGVYVAVLRAGDEVARVRIVAIR